MPNRRSWLALGAFLALTFAAASIGSLFTDVGRNGWYEQLEKPPWNPPGWVFGPVWTVLYVAMAVAAWRVWRRRGLRDGAGALSLWGVQLVLNMTWSAVFFGMQAPGAAFAEIVVLWAAIVATTVVFFRIDRAAGWLFVPYLGWVTFAAALNFSIWRLNA